MSIATTSFERTVILAAHGSPFGSVNDKLNQFAHELQEQQFDNQVQVLASFNLGVPGFDQVLDLAKTGDVTVLPLMTSDGYYTREMLPSKMDPGNLDISRFEILPPIGIHDSMTRVIEQELDSTIKEFDVPKSDTSVVVVGHGTRRNSNSRLSTWEISHHLIINNSEPGCERFAQIQTAFLDDDPVLQEVVPSLTANNVIVIPYLITEGPHYYEDIPEAFGLPAIDANQPNRVFEVGGRNLILLRSLVFNESVQSLIREVIDDAR